MPVGKLHLECYSRGIDCYRKNRPQLESEMQEVMRGVKRVAALGFQADWDYIEKCNLTKYELASIAPLHDGKGLIRNYFDELLHHGSEEDKEIIRNIKAVELDSKDKVTYITY